MLPFKQAIYLPFDFYYNIRFVNIKGRVCINSSRIYRGMIKFGAQGSDMFDRSPLILDIRGRWDFNGPVSIGVGSTIRIEEKGLLTMEKGVVIGARSLLFCENSILIKRFSITSWNCQIMDTDTHSIIDVGSEEVSPRSSPVIIGENCWIGNNVLINKGVQLPNCTIVGSFSLCNKDYTYDVKPFSILAGVPVKVVSKNKKMLGDKL